MTIHSATEPPPRVNFTVGAARLLGKKHERIVGLFLHVFYTGRDRFGKGEGVFDPNGRVTREIGVPNTGRFEVSFRPRLTWNLRNNSTLNVELNIPLYTRIRMDAENRDLQLTEPVGVFLSLSQGF